MLSRLPIIKGGVLIIVFSFLFSIPYSYGNRPQTNFTQTVDIISFIGKQVSCDVELIWASASEEQFSHYQLERSTNGIDFQAIKTIYGRGGNFTQSYSYVDESASIGYNYYRLKMVNIDESISYTRGIEVVNSCGDLQSNDVMIFPNPIAVGGQLVSIKFFANTEANTVILTDGLGSLIRELELELIRGWNTITIDTNGLPGGMYTLSQTDKTGKIKSRKLIIIE